MDETNTTVASGRAMLHVSRWGTAGPAIVVLHPGVGDTRIWNACAPHWAAAGYQVVGYDRRGFGSTQCSPEPHDDMTDLVAVMNATNVWSAIVVGNSRGGGLALDLALAYPERVRALLLLAPSPSGYDYDDWLTVPAEAEQDVLIAAADDSGDLELVNRLEARYWLDGVAQVEGRVCGKPRELFMEMNALALGAAPIGDASDQPAAWPRLAEIDVPVLVAAGQFDLPGVQKQCGELAAAVSSAELVEIPRSAHCPQLDQADFLTKMALEFFGTVDA